MIREKNGIHVEDDGKKVLDGYAENSEIFVSHAHFDHFSNKSGLNIVCSDLTADLVGSRSSKSFSRNRSHDFELFDSGHVLGSSAVRFQTEKYGSVLYTGDFSTRSRAFLDGFEPVEADTLIMETTYGVDYYSFPSEEEFITDFQEFLSSNSGESLFLFGYSLGKAQKILYYLEEMVDRPVYIYHTIDKVIDVYRRVLDVDFDFEVFELDNVGDKPENSIFVLPSSISRNDNVEEAVKKVEGLKAGFSGWGVSDSYQYRGGYDKVFPLSDHADFRELEQTVDKVNPKEVYTFHGFDEEFAKYLRKEKGINARALKRNQSSLSDF